MADRYWVGTDQNWHDPNNWSLTSGGVGGAGIPTSVDDVYIDGNGYVLCWATAPVECNNFTIESTATEMNLFDQGGIIYGNFLQDAGYFAPTGGGGYIFEFKGNWTCNGGTFAVGTGTGIDPTCLFSGTGKTYVLNNPSAASFQNFSVTGTYTLSGTRLSVAWVSQEFRCTGTMTISSGNRIDLVGSFEEITGTIDGDGRFFYHYNVGNSIPSEGTIECQYFMFYIEDPVVVLTPRIFEATCEVEIEYTADGQVFRFDGSARHCFCGNFTIYCDEVTVTVAELDFKTNTAEIWVGDVFQIDQDAFPNATFTISWGAGVHILSGSVIFYFSYSSSNAHLARDSPEEETIILMPGASLSEISIIVGGGI